MQLVMRVLQCFIWCFEKFMKFMTKHAYIQVALMGTNFCSSAKAAFYNILRNFARFGAHMVLGTIIQFLGYTFIVVATTAIGYFILQALHPDVSPTLPMISYAIMSYVIAMLFMTVFGLAVDTILHCFIAAEEMEDVSMV